MRLTARTIITLVFASLCAIAPAGATPTKAEARVTAAAAAFATTTARHQAGAAPADAVYLWSVRWLDAQRDPPLKGKALADWPVGELARQRGLLPQAQHDAFSASVTDVVLLGRHPHLGRWAWESAADRRVARAALHSMDLETLTDHDVTTLSGGERQRVGLAALLTQDPPLLLLDEPVSHLDLHHQVTVLEHLRRLAHERGRACLMSIHDLNLAARFCTHALVIGPGAKLHQGPAESTMNEVVLSAAFGHPVAAERFGERTVFVAD